jgi:hypothetical protein
MYGLFNLFQSFYFPLLTFAVPKKGNVDFAGVAKLVDVPDLGSGAARHGGSSPSTRTKPI